MTTDHAFLGTALAVAGLLLLAGAVGTAGAQQGTASADIQPQASGGVTVVVDSVTLPDGGFVTIHDASLLDGATLASVRGSSKYLGPGTHRDVMVTLDDPIASDATLVAMPHRDTDGDRVYEFVSENGETDGPYTADGEIVTDAAQVTASATVRISDQTSDGASVVVDRVALSAPGFVTIHDATVQDGDVFDSVRGTSERLGAGVHRDVRVALDAPIDGDATLIAMPHRDTDGDGSYDFVESEGSDDGPFTADGGAVVDSAAITVSDTATASLADQVSGGSAVTVDSVFVPDGGFVTLHDDTLLDGEALGSVRGTSGYLEPGLHRDVRVHLDDPLGDDGTLIAMPHRDTDGDETYDFVESEGGADGPYTADGGAVTDAGDVTVSASARLDRQRSDGTTVTVADADLSEGGFVTLHDASLLDGEALGSVVGTSDYLDAGHHDDVTVALDAPIDETQRLIAMPHRDTDGDEAYDFVEQEGGADGPYTADGVAVTDTGLVHVTAHVAISDQTADGADVTVDAVTLHDGGFVTIHDGTLLDGDALGSVRGTSAYLSPGHHEDVTVTLDGDVDAEMTAIAMPHRDTDGDETYDFVASEGADDGPYTSDAGAVVDDATVAPSDGAMDDDGSDEADDGSPMPGFAVAAALIAVAAVALARRR